MATDKVQVPNELGQLQALMSLIGGGGGQTQNVTTTNTAPLQTVLSQLQGVDYNAMLQGIFQQAAGQIPGLQSAYGRAVGARSSGNAPMQAALQALLQQTTLAGQQQVAAQQNQNMATQVQAASAMTGKRQTTKQNSQLGQMAAILGLAQAATKLGGYKTVQEMLGAVTGTGTGTGTGGGTAAPIAPSTVSMDYTLPQNVPFADSPYASFAGFTGPAYTPGQDMTTADIAPVDTAAYTPVDFNVANYAVDQAPAPEMSMAPEEWFQQPDAMQWF